MEQQQSVFIWLAPTLSAMFAWGIAQGLVKKYVGDTPPARFCLFYGIANACVGSAWFAYAGNDQLLAPENREFLIAGLLSYIFDGIAWIFYYKSIVHGPIAIVGTASAAYPALTVIGARIILHEEGTAMKYVGIVFVLVGCACLGFSPDDEGKKTSKWWMLYAAIALVIWGGNGVLFRYAYTRVGANDGNYALLMAIGGVLTLGVYGFIFGRKGMSQGFVTAFGPMAVMSTGTLLTNIAYKNGQASLVTLLSGAYPVVTLVFAMIVLKERPTKLGWVGIVAILSGMLCTTLPDVLAATNEPAPVAAPDAPAPPENSPTQ